jgi:hypothetical protein
VGVVKNAVAGLGFDQDAPMVTFPIDVFLIESDLTPVENGKQRFLDGLLEWKPASDSTGIRNTEMIDLDVEDYEQAVVKTNNLFLMNLWSDGLPLIPPTTKRVDWILEGTDRPRDEQVGKFMPRGGIVTVETVAISLAMAGGRPEYLPVLLAAVETILEPEMDHDKWQSTSGMTFPVVVVNGPIAKEIRLNSGFGMMGPNPQAPAGGSIGRALRLMQQNVGGALPGTGTMAIFGAMRYTNAVIAEAEALMPESWDPHGTEVHGFARGTNSVSVFVATGGNNIIRRGTGKETLEVEAHDSLRRVATYMQTANPHFVRGWHGGSAGAVILSPVVARQLSEQGWTKDKIREFLWERSKLPKDMVVESGLEQWIRSSTDPVAAAAEIDPVWPICETPDGIILLVGGGAHPTHNFWLQGNAKTIGKRLIDTPKNWVDLLKQADVDIGCADDMCII